MSLRHFINFVFKRQEGEATVAKVPKPHHPLSLQEVAAWAFGTDLSMTDL